MSKRWKDLASREDEARQGFAEYAFQKSEMFAQRSTEASECLQWARTVHIKEKQTQRILNEPSLYT